MFPTPRYRAVVATALCCRAAGGVAKTAAAGAPAEWGGYIACCGDIARRSRL
jgi:hypothetical protein